MKLSELVKKYTFDEVKKDLFKLYPGQKKSERGYREALEELKKTKPKKNKDDFTITIMEVGPLIDADPEDTEDTYWDVSGKKKGSKQSWALEYSPWNEWLLWKVDDKAIKELGEITCLCHILFEMTFTGYTNKQVIEAKKKLYGTLKKVKKQIKEEKNNGKNIKRSSNQKGKSNS